MTISTSDLSFFTKYWPLDSANTVDLTSPFLFESQYCLDPVRLENSFSIQPEVDSLSFVKVRSGRIMVHHAALLPDTSYRIMIHESMMSQRGVALGSAVIISFSTMGTK